MSELLATLSLNDTTSSRHIPQDESTVDYGAAARNLEGHGEKTHYITTAIAYTNGYPHMGHAYEFLTADVLARFHRVLGYDTFFLTGSDEHGQKVAASAAAVGRTPKEHCDIYCNAFKALNQRLKISCDQYIRTTDEHHKETARKLWKRCSDVGDIYLDRYEGWYNEREETFVTDSDATLWNFLDPGSGKPLKKVTEESYFFRLSKYTDRLIAHIETNLGFVQPEQFKTEILARLKKDGLRDLSLSRTTFTWGISMPEGFDDRHVMYVWFDALTNYISGVHIFDESSPLRRYWPAQRHIIGKDIIWFHCVIWPCMLMSAGLPLPEGVFSHGFVNDKDGRKMSKSFNNTVDPHDVLDRVPCDSIRYYMAMTATYGSDVAFSEEALTTMHNSELADILGNLVNRVLTLSGKYCDGVVPDCRHDPSFPPPFDLTALIEAAANDIGSCSINIATFRTMEVVRATNKFLTDAEPWKMKGADEPRRAVVVRTALESIYVFSHFLAPVIPLAANLIFGMLNTKPRAVTTLRADFYNLSPGTPLTPGGILFKKIEAPLASPTLPLGGSGGGLGPQKPSKEKDTRVYDPDQPVFSKMELRVGRIVNVRVHEAADTLYCEEIDVGEPSLRPVASGLRASYTLEEMQGRRVIVVCNLKEANMRGFVSMGMVLVAASEDKSVEQLLTPPENAEIGERVIVPGYEGEPWPPAKIKKDKIWEDQVKKLLSTDSNCRACFDGKPLETEKSHAYITVPSNANCKIY